MFLFLFSSVAGVTLNSDSALPKPKSEIFKNEISSVLKSESLYSYTSTMERSMDNCGDYGDR